MNSESNIFMFRFSDGNLFIPPCTRFEIIESINDGIRWCLDIKALNWDILSDMIDGKEEYYQHFDFKFGTDILSSGNQNTGWYHGVVLKINQVTKYMGADIRIIGGDKSLWMKSRSRTQAWRSSFTDVVNQIGADYGLTVDIESPRNQDSPSVYWQHGENDWEFLKGYSKLFVSSGRGLSDYSVWLQHGTTLKFQPPGRNNIPSKVWSYSGEGDVIKRLKFVQRKQALQMFGGMNIRGVSYDMNTKELLVSDRNYEEYPENSALGSRVTLPGNGEYPAMTFTTNATNQAELDAKTAARIGDRHRKMYSAIIDIFPDTEGYEVGDIVTLKISQNGEGANDNTFSGNYIVEKRKSLYTMKDRSMQLLLSRVGSNIGEQSVPGVSMDRAPIISSKGEGREREVSKI